MIIKIIKGGSSVKVSVHSFVLAIKPAPISNMKIPEHENPRSALDLVSDQITNNGTSVLWQEREN